MRSMVLNLFTYSALTVVVTSVILILLLLKYGKTSMHFIWGLFNVSILVWGGGLFLATIADNYHESLMFLRIAFGGAIFISILFFHLATFFYKYKRTILWVAYLQGGIVLILILVNGNNFLPSAYKLLGSFYYLELTTILSIISAAVWSLWIVLGFFGLFKAYLYATGKKRNQLLYLVVGMCIGWTGGLFYVLPFFRIQIFPLGNFTIPIYCLLVTYAILKHRLLDVKVAFTRGAILLIVYAFIVGIPVALLMLGKPLLVKYFGTDWFVPPLGLYTILALLGPYIYLNFQNKAEEKRMKQQVRLHQSLKAASKTTIEVQSVDKLSKIIPRYLLKLYRKLDNKIMHISMFLHDKENNVYHMQSSVGEQKIPVDTLVRADNMLVKWFTIIRDKLVDEGVMRASDVEVLVYEDIDYWLNNPNVLRKPFKGLDKVLKELKKIMESYKANLILPSVYQKELLGFLMLGEKTPDPYSISDISTFSILANDSAMAFKAAQLFEDLKVAQASLIQSEKLNLLGQLASSMAHEINNPLAIISGNVQLLLMDETDEGKKKFLQKISDQTERGYKIIHRLLNFSRLPKEEIKVIKVHQMIDETLELIGHKIKHGNIELKKEYNEVPDINGNPTQIQEVLLNLFVNGIQSMEEGGALNITTAVVKHKVEIVISDTGKGIDEKDVQNIFDPFYTKGKEKGTGLGLFVASQVMGLHKGTINVKSKVGQGTTFVLQFSIEKN